MGAYKHSDPDKKGKRKRIGIKDRTRRSVFNVNNIDGSVSDRSGRASHEARFIFKLVEWSEQLSPVTSVRLGVVRRTVRIRLCTEQRVEEKLVQTNETLYLGNLKRKIELY